MADASVVSFTALCLHLGATEEEADKIWKKLQGTEVPFTPKAVMDQIRTELDNLRTSDWGFRGSN